MNSAVYSAYESLVKRGEYPFSLLNITIPFDQLDVNVHPMKIEVKFIDEWRVYHIVKSAVKDSISAIMSTIPSFENPQLGTFGKVFTQIKIKNHLILIFFQNQRLTLTLIMKKKILAVLN